MTWLIFWYCRWSVSAICSPRDAISSSPSSVRRSPYGAASNCGLRSALCRWLLVRAGLVWRLLAGEAARGEGRWYGFMVGDLLQVRIQGQVRRRGGMGQAEGRLREERLSLRRNQASPRSSHHACSRGQGWVVTVRKVSQKTCPRGRGMIRDCGSGNSHGCVLREGEEVSKCLRRMAEISSHW